jgi:cation diffusion facilitator CzcD-associated flavoprotein CzcO
MQSYDVIVIGSGQAGLAAGYFLKKKGLAFVLLDKGKGVGQTRKNRYDSLILFTPRFYWRKCNCSHRTVSETAYSSNGRFIGQDPHQSYNIVFA